MTGKRYRLLTEAEYEYASARRHATRPIHGATTSARTDANCNGCGSQWDNDQNGARRLIRSQRRSVSYDMVGNVFGVGRRIARIPNYRRGANGRLGVDKRRVPNAVSRRGGSWSFFPQDLRSAHRTGVFTDRRFDFIARIQVASA